MNVFIIKRDGSKVEFDKTKISNAIEKANQSVNDCNDKATFNQINLIADYIEHKASSLLTNNDTVISVEEVQDEVESKLIEIGKSQLAKNYITYRYKRKIIRDTNELDESILKLVREENELLQDENANKNAKVIYTQRDLIAGETSKHITRRILLPEHIVNAHDDGIFHFHDMDYFVQKSFNCCLVNIRDMLDNGTVINDKMIETPKSFQVACNVMTQIITAVSSSQYGGTSVDISALGKYLRVSKNKFEKMVRETIGEASEDIIQKMVDTMLKKELESGIQTIQYQINTMATTNGQSPFVTLFMYLREDEYVEENAAIFEEMFRQRLRGIKNKVGVYISPSFPQVVYVVSPLNNLTGGKYDYITKLAVKCIAKRMMPDIISEKRMKETYEGNVFSPMGCRSFLSPWKDENGEYKFEGRLTA